MSITCNVLRRFKEPVKSWVSFRSSSSKEQKTQTEGDCNIQLKIYRFDPECDKKPRYQVYNIPDYESGNLVLDALLYIKNEVDPTLTFRRSCREGVCGSCAMNINGLNRLACITKKPKKLKITPLPQAFVIKDLVVDLTNFFKQHKSVEPWLQRRIDEPEGERQLLQSVRDWEKLNMSMNCVLCACCSYGCPTYWWHGNNENSFLGPAAILQAYRWFIDSRDEKHQERICKLKDYFKVFRCHTILNCTNTCPKHLNPGFCVSEMKRYITGVKTKEEPDIPNPPLPKFGTSADPECLANKKHEKKPSKN